MRSLISTLFFYTLFLTLLLHGAPPLVAARHSHHPRFAASTQQHDRAHYTPHLLFRRDVWSDIGNFFTHAGEGIKNGIVSVGNSIKNGLETVGNGVGQGLGVVGVALTTGFDQKAIDAQAAKTDQTFADGAAKTNAEFAQDVQQTNQQFIAAGDAITRFGIEFAHGVVYIGQKAIQGIIQLAKTAWTWILKHKAEIAGIVAGIIVSTIVAAGLTLTTMNPVLAGALASAAGAFVGSEVQQVVQAAEDGSLRAPTSFGDFMNMAGHHLENDAIPVATAALGGAVGSAVGQAVGQAAAASASQTFGTTAQEATANGIGDVLSANGDGFLAKGSTWLAQKISGSGSNTLVHDGSQQLLNAAQIAN